MDESRFEVDRLNFSKEKQKAYTSDLQDFCLIEIVGKDAADYLHRQLSNEIRNLEVGQGTSVCYLNAQGRIRLQFFLWKTETGYLATIFGSQRNRFLEEMERLVFREEIQFVDRTPGKESLVVWGPETPGRLKEILGAEGELEGMQFQQMRLGETKLLVFRPDWLLPPVFHLIAEPEVLDDLRGQWEGCGWQEAHAEEFHSLRIEKGTAWPDFEIDDSMIPYECGLENSVSLTKGCYVGQEVIARMANLGAPPRALRGLILETERGEIPLKGTPIQYGEVVVGEVLSSGFSDRLGRKIATSSIRKKFISEGTDLSVGGKPAKVSLFPIETTQS